MFWKEALSKKNFTTIWSCLYFQEIWCLVRKRKIIFFNKDTWTFDIFCIFGKDVIPFSYKDALRENTEYLSVFVRIRENTNQKKLFGHFSCKDYITLLSKIKDDLLPKNTLKDDNSGTTGKDVTHPRKYGISLIEQLEIIKKFTQSLLTHREN